MIKSIKGGITAVSGFQAAGVNASIKKGQLPDLALIASDRVCSTAGVFTSNRFAAPSIFLTRQHIRSGQLQAIIANSGCANACTGPQGEADAQEMSSLAAKQLRIPKHLVGVASTGVIGNLMPMERIRSAVPRLIKSLSPQGGHRAAQAILTTDTSTKEVAVQVAIDGRQLTVGGIAKGSGMIHPKLISTPRKATMLAFLTTDASIDTPLLQQALQTAVDQSFNMISVDGETSTNDMVLLMANGTAKGSKLPAASPAFELFQLAVNEVCISLAKMIARDGEGATKLVEIIIRQAKILAIEQHRPY